MKNINKSDNYIWKNSYQKKSDLKNKFLINKRLLQIDEKRPKPWEQNRWKLWEHIPHKKCTKWLLYDV